MALWILGVALTVGENLSLKLPLCTRLVIIREWKQLEGKLQALAFIIRVYVVYELHF